LHVLGPLTTGIGAGYDHIAGAIGGALAAAAGAGALCSMTPADHLRLPDFQDLREGVIAMKIAAHSGDVAKGVFGAGERDDRMSACRRGLDWEGQYRLSLDPERARESRRMSGDDDEASCRICGTICSLTLENTRQRPGELLTTPEGHASHHGAPFGPVQFRREPTL